MREKVNILMVDDQPGKLLSYEAILDVLGENVPSFKFAVATGKIGHVETGDMLPIQDFLPTLSKFTPFLHVSHVTRHRQRVRFRRTARIEVCCEQCHEGTVLVARNEHRMCQVLYENRDRLYTCFKATAPRGPLRSDSNISRRPSPWL